MSKEEKSVVVNTMQIADTLKCQHHKIMKRLETYLKRHPEHKADIILTQYEVGTGRFYKMYDLTQKGLQIYLKMRYEDAGRNSPDYGRIAAARKAHKRGGAADWRGF